MNLVNTPTDRNGVATRAYSSVIRREAALYTRERIVRAAAECFDRAGYSATTIRTIAEAADVSTGTVTGQGPKSELLFAAFELAFTGREGDDPAANRPQFAAALDESTPEGALRVFVGAAADAFGRSLGVWRAMNAAADVEPVVAAGLADMLGRREAEFARMVRHVGALGMPVADVGRAAQVLLVFVSHEAFDHLVRVSGWTQAEYEEWAVTQCLAALRR